MRGTHQGQQSARTASTGRTHDCKRHLHHAPHDLLRGGGHPHMNQSVVSPSSNVMGGTAVFYGTRVPVQTLLDYLEAGESIDEFLEGFPSVTREQVIAFLEQA